MSSALPLIRKAQVSFASINATEIEFGANQSLNSLCSGSDLILAPLSLEHVGRRGESVQCFWL